MCVCMYECICMYVCCMYVCMYVCISQYQDSSSLIHKSSAACHASPHFSCVLTNSHVLNLNIACSRMPDYYFFDNLYESEINCYLLFIVSQLLQMFWIFFSLMREDCSNQKNLLLYAHVLGFAGIYPMMSETCSSNN